MGGARAGGGAAMGGRAGTSCGGGGVKSVTARGGRMWEAGCGGAAPSRHSAQSMPSVSSTALPLPECTIRVAPLPLEQISSMVRGCTSGEASVAPMLKTSHTTTHQRRRFSDRRVSMSVARVLVNFKMRIALVATAGKWSLQMFLSILIYIN